MTPRRRHLVLALVLLGCGTADPFSRGEPSTVSGNGGEGPGPGGDGGSGGGGTGGGGGSGGGGPTISFKSDVDPILDAKCVTCHAASPGGFTMTGSAKSDYAPVRQRVNPKDPAQSLLLRKARGESHGGNAVLSTSSDAYHAILTWVGEGARDN